MVDAGERTGGRRHNPMSRVGGRCHIQWNYGGLGRVGWNDDANIGSPTVVGDADPPEAVRGVAPPSKEDFLVG